MYVNLMTLYQMSICSNSLPTRNSFRPLLQFAIIKVIPRSNACTCTCMYTFSFRLIFVTGGFSLRWSDSSMTMDYGGSCSVPTARHGRGKTSGWG